MNPMIFVSAVSAEFAQSRQLVVNVLTRLGYTPVFQDIFGTESGDLREVLRRKIDRCEGLIQIVGDGYGAEPPTVDTEFGRVSYTQFEFLYAAKKGLKTWVLEVGDGFPRDRPADQLDLPPAGSTADPKAYQEERQELQKAYRTTLKTGGHLRHKAADRTDLQLRMEQLRDELAELRAEFEKWKASLAGDVQNVPEAVARRLNPWAWAKRHKWAVSGVLALLVVVLVVGLVWQGANQRAAAETAAAADDANRAWDQVKGIDRGQAVGGKLDAAEAKLRLAGERSARGDHGGAIAEYREARELARGLIETDLLRQRAVAARGSYEASHKQVGNTFGEPAAGEAARLFDAGDFPAATAKWDAARRAGEAGQARKQLDQELTRYDVKRLEPLTPELWKAYREAEAAANAAVESGDSELVQAKFADAKKALDAATEPARCHAAFVLGYVGVMLLKHDQGRLRAAELNDRSVTVEQMGAFYPERAASLERDAAASVVQALRLPDGVLSDFRRLPTVTAEAVQGKEKALASHRDAIGRANGRRVELWCAFGRLFAQVEYAGEQNHGRWAPVSVLNPKAGLPKPTRLESLVAVLSARRWAHEAGTPPFLRDGMDKMAEQVRNGHAYWHEDAERLATTVRRSLLGDHAAAVRLIAGQSAPPPTGDDLLVIRLGGAVDRTRPDRVAVRLDWSFADNADLREVAAIAGLTDLDIGNSGRLNNDGLTHLATCVRLRSLRVAESNVGPGAGQALQKLTGLEVLKVGKNQIPADEVAELQKALPKLKIEP